MLAKSISGAAAAASPVFVEDTFSSYLYTGTGATQTITNGIDLAGKGGLVWIKGRSGATGHRLTDTARGATKSLESNSTAAEVTESTGLTAFGSTGFTIGADADYNTSTATYVSWAFRKQAKFFDVVTYTGDGVAGRQISHNLGSTPGCIIIKNYSGPNAGVRGWPVWHRTLAEDYYLLLNNTNAQIFNDGFPPFGKPSQQTSTYFTVGQSDAIGVNGLTNVSGETYVAYLFAHNAGGFGLTGTDNVISCGSFTTGTNTNFSVNLGWEPQWIIFKNASSTEDWFLVDDFRGFNADRDAKRLNPNTSNSEGTKGVYKAFPSGPSSTTFGGSSDGTGATNFLNNSTYIYIAIRRGPMKVPTSGTSVFTRVTRTGTGAAAAVTGVGFPPDFVMSGDRSGLSNRNAEIFDRLRGANPFLATALSNSEFLNTNGLTSFDQNGITLGDDSGAGGINRSGSLFVNYFMRRAPGFFDVVAYTGTGANRTVNHNLAAVPEMMIVKRRDSTADWWVYNTATGNTKYQVLNSTATPVTSSTAWNNTTPTSTVFTVGTGTPVNASAGTYIAYLFATTPGVSKVGSYTGTGTTKQIDCGFTGGARFVLIKRTDSTGDWYVWDTARGIVAGNDPYLLLNSTAAEVTNTDYIDTYSAGFEISSTAPAAINANGGTFIFLAIA